MINYFNNTHLFFMQFTWCPNHHDVQSIQSFYLDDVFVFEKLLDCSIIYIWKHYIKQLCKTNLKEILNQPDRDHHNFSKDIKEYLFSFNWIF
jgi:hypothetical protein